MMVCTAHDADVGWQTMWRPPELEGAGSPCRCPFVRAEGDGTSGSELPQMRRCQVGPYRHLEPDVTSVL